jgi:catechol 2,3-dioxygenase-like lactoylglutathione lyase family enzyme
MSDADRKANEALPRLPQRLHHYAIVIRDQEANRQFLEGLLGIPLTATWCEKAFNQDMQREIEYCHTFYELADGGALAFFQYADNDVYERLKPNNLQIGQHVAFKADRATFDEICRRLDQAAYPYRKTDHGYCLSVYVQSPDNLRLEFTVDCDDIEEITAMRRRDAHSELKRWLAGDRRPNNDIRH